MNRPIEARIADIRRLNAAEQTASDARRAVQAAYAAVAEAEDTRDELRARLTALLAQSDGRIEAA